MIKEGNTPYGFRVRRHAWELAARIDGTWRENLTRDESEQLVIQTIQDMRGAHGLSYAAIARWLNDAGVKTRRGTSWSRQRVFQVWRDCT